METNLINNFEDKRESISTIETILNKDNVVKHYSSDNIFMNDYKMMSNAGYSANVLADNSSFGKMYGSQYVAVQYRRAENYQPTALYCVNPTKTHRLIL